MAAYGYYLLITRLRIDDDGSAAIEIMVPTDAGDDVIAEWDISYLPSAAQDRVRYALRDMEGVEPPLDVSTSKPDSKPSTHPQN